MVNMPSFVFYVVPTGLLIICIQYTPRVKTRGYRDVTPTGFMLYD